MKQQRNYITEVPVRVAGIPCIAAVTHFFCQRPLGPSAHSDLDCYGYTEINYTILDRKGYPAAWLEKKITPSIEEQIEALILDDMRS